MKNKERQRLLRVHGQKYRIHRHESIYRNECFYCADTANTYDHCPPLSLVEGYSNSYWKKEKIPFVMVWSCSNCNSMLGNKPLMSLYERTQFIEDKLLDKYDKAHNLWTEAELQELGYSLQVTVRAKMEQAKWTLERARNAQNRLLNFDSFPKWEDD